MSIEKAIERIEKLRIKHGIENFMGESLTEVLEILKEEAESPCERCKELEKKIKELEDEVDNAQWEVRGL